MKKPALLFLFFTSFPVFAQLPKSIPWEVKPIFPLVRKVVYLNDRFIAGGFDGEIMHSADGEVWSGSFTGEKIWVTDFAFANGKYYAVQQEDLLVSTNLTVWERFTNSFAFPARALLHQDGVFLAAGSRIWRSPNGTEWELLAFRPRSIRSLAYGNGTYVGVGLETIISSTNGMDWREVSGTGGYGVIFDGRRFVAVGNGVHTSTNGQGWIRSTELRSGWDLAARDGRYVVPMGWGGLVFNSTDAETWTLAKQVTENLLHSVAYGKDRFVVGGWGPILVSEDGTNFTRTFAAPRSTRAITHGNGMLLIAGALGEGRDPAHWTNQPALFTSTDKGASWRFRQAPWNWDEPARTLKHLNGKFIAVGESGMIAISENAQEWSIARLGSDRWQGVEYGAGKYCVGGGFGPNPSVALSADGTNWVVSSSGLPDAINAIAYGAGRFVAAGGGPLIRNGYVAGSTNGVDWEIGLQRLTNQVREVVFGAGKFVAVGENGLLLTSPDGMAWQQQPQLGSNHLSAVCFAAGLFVAPGGSTRIWSSSDGENWITHETGFEQSHTDIGFADGRFILTGAEHWLVQSAPVLPRLEITPKGPLLRLKVYQLPGIEAEIQTSADLLNWIPLSTSLQPELDGSAVGELSPNLRQQFLRAVSRSSLP